MDNINEREMYLDKFEKQIDRMFHYEQADGGISPAAYCDAQELIKSCNEYIDADSENSYRRIKDSVNKFVETCKVQMEEATENGNITSAKKYHILRTEAEIIKLTMSLKKEMGLSGNLSLVQMSDMSEKDIEKFKKICVCPNCKSNNVAVVYNAKSKHYFVQCQTCHSRLQKFSAESVAGAMSTWNLCCRMANEIREKYDPDNDNFNRELECEIPSQA